MMKFCSILVTLEPSGFIYRKKAQGGAKTRFECGIGLRCERACAWLVNTWGILVSQRMERTAKATVEKNAYLVHEGRNKHLEGASPKPRRGDCAVPYRFAPLKLAEDDDEQEEEAV